MSKNKPSPFRQIPSDRITREFKRHDFKVRVTTGPPEFVPLGENEWGIAPPSNGGPRGLEWVRFQAENMKAFLDARGLSRSPHRLEEAGYDRLSNKGLAARLLFAAEIVLSEKLPVDTRLDYAVRFGHLETQLSVLLSADDNMPEPPKSREKLWAKELARELRRERPGRTFEKAWKAIPAAPKDRSIAGWCVCREDDALRAESENGHKIERLTKGSFRTGYWVKSKEK